MALAVFAETPITGTGQYGNLPVLQDQRVSFLQHSYQSYKLENNARFRFQEDYGRETDYYWRTFLNPNLNTLYGTHTVRVETVPRSTIIVGQRWLHRSQIDYGNRNETNQTRITWAPLIQPDSFQRLASYDVIKVVGFEVDNKSIVARRSVTFRQELDETKQYLMIQDDHFGIHLIADSREELEQNLYEELDFLWRQYAMEKNDVLSKDAMALKSQLLYAFKESR